ncbi:MAG: enoyl-ACP reductase [Deltaproteobacteria bacterium]|nr:enoyl-ACP reductase [Deltaproteobacteria bacterium]
MGLLDGRKALIMGVANERSIAWAIAEAFKKEGAELAFTYGAEVLKDRVTPLAESVGSKLILPCDVTKDEDIDKLFDKIKEEWGSLNILVHSIAFAKKEELKGRFVDTSRDGFSLAMDISAYSLVATARRALPLMVKGESSIVTLSYLGAERVVQNYNVMGVAKAALESSVKYLAADIGQDGVRVNAISAGPIKTLAAMGISGFSNILNAVKEKAPLKQNVTSYDVAGTATYLASDLASGVTGEIIYVDSGFNIIGF